MNYNDHMTTPLELGKIGIWTWTLDGQPMAKSCEAVQELEELGFKTVWIPEAVGREPFAHAGILLSATKKLILGTGIASMYARTASTMQAGQKTLTSAFPDRFLLGIGASHGNMVKSLHKTAYVKPYSTMVEYLDVMDGGMFMAAAPTTPLHRVLAALGPKMLKLAGERADGAHPYFTTPKHTAVAREISPCLTHGSCRRAFLCKISRIEPASQANAKKYRHQSTPIDWCRLVPTGIDLTIVQAAITTGSRLFPRRRSAARN